jgi:ketosteroid isomerase-like protein
MSTNAEVARAMFAAYRAQDLAAASALLAEGFEFTSPQDDHIDKDAWLERCFPTVEHFTDFEMLEVVDAGPETVFVRYRYTLSDGSSYTNMEALVIRDDRVAVVTVHFGGALRT